MGVHYLPATGDCNATESGHQFLAQRYYKCGQGDWVIGDDRGHGAKHVLCERPKLRLKRFEKGDSLYSKRMRVLSALKDDTRSVEERKALLRGLRTPPPRKPHEGDKYTFSHPSPTAEQLALFMRKPRPYHLITHIVGHEDNFRSGMIPNRCEGPPPHASNHVPSQGQAHKHPAP
eukprot:Sspe_Gene.78733::Locus_49281_Transcript_5_5_Confidence_0.765_Length_572::g.78733::m.78733